MAFRLRQYQLHHSALLERVRHTRYEQPEPDFLESGGKGSVRHQPLLQKVVYEHSVIQIRVQFT